VSLILAIVPQAHERQALGISIHTGWGAAVLVAGTPDKPEVLANERIRILGDDERFCFDMAAEMKRPATHPRIHTAEGCFFRDVLAEACPIPVRIVPPKTLDDSKVGKIAPAPWGRDQRLAALAAWAVLGGNKR
jgi:hypothetical protein